MSKSIASRTLFLLSTLLLSACVQPSTAKDESAGDGEGGEGGGGGGGAGSGEATAIYDIQMNTFDEGTVVTIKDVVVTSQLIEGDYPAFFVQSPEGGEYNGIYIFKYDEVEYTPAIGDIVTITGEYTEHFDNTQLVVKGASDVELTGTGGEVVVTEIDTEPDNWEAYESVVVQINNAEIADASMLYEWGAVQLTIGCWIDNVFTNYDAEDGATYTSITGPLTYSFEKYAILPRFTADLGEYDGTVGGSQGEETICDDGLDDDGDGYTDCDDWDCDDDPICGGSGGGSGGDGEDICDDGVDNDDDGYTDCDDWDCDDDPICGGSGGDGEDICDDGVDNDDDGYTDCDDWDCDDDPICGGSGGDGETICDDGLDDDGDGYTDCDDWDCDDDPVCGGSGGDGDGDGEDICDDGVDNDDDGYTDCDDWDCDDDPACTSTDDSFSAVAGLDLDAHDAFRPLPRSSVDFTD
jgi:hypothetical protein